MAWQAILGTVAQAAAPIIGKLFGGSSESSGRVDLKQLVKDAQRAGFNPLTVLRNGGAAGYQQTQHPSLSMGSVVAEALGAVGHNLVNYDPHAAAKRQAETAMHNAMLENLQADTALKGRMGFTNVPVKTGASVVAPVTLATGPAPVVGETTVTNPFPAGGEVNPNLKDAESGEARYGDILQEVFGVFNAVGDLAHNVRRFTTEEYDFRKTPIGQAWQWWNGPALGVDAPTRMPSP